MGFTVREALTIIHGMVLGGLLLLVFSGVFAGLWSLRRLKDFYEHQDRGAIHSFAFF